MPKYTITVQFQPTVFEFDTDDLVEELADADTDPNDPDAVADFARDILDSGDDIFGLDYPEAADLKIERAK